MVTGLLVLAAIAAMVDWWAVGSSRRPVELVAKPATMALLVVVAATAGDPTADVRAALVLGALLGLVGDVALLGTGETAFLVGLAAFAAGHLSYAAAALRIGFEVSWALPGLAFVAVLLGYRFLGETLPGARRSGGSRLAGAVAFYAVVISAMSVTAWATGEPLAALGAVLFAASDWVLGYQRFVRPLPGHRVSIMIPYHVGQAMLIVGLANA